MIRLELLSCIYRIWVVRARGLYKRLLRLVSRHLGVIMKLEVAVDSPLVSRDDRLTRIP